MSAPSLLARVAIRLALVLLVVACRPRGKEESGKAGEETRATLSFTHWGSRTELFVELPALVQGMESRCAAHVTRLSDWKPLEAGTVTMALRDGDERAASDRPSEPGIFRPVLRPSRAGKRRLVAIVEDSGGRDEHDLGEVLVHASKEELAKAPPEARAPARIAFLKEQQWATAFATEAVAERAIRASVRATAVLRARTEGDVVIAAPFAGRIASQGAFPRLGARVAAEETLATLTPRLEATDRASLDFAVASARLELQHAERERRRLDALQAEGAVPERRAVEAAHVEEQAKETLSSAERRLAQFARVQQPRGGAGEGSVTLRSPIRGAIAAVEAAPGAFVEAGAAVFRVVDPTQLWLEARIAAVDAARASDVRGAWFEVEGVPEPVDLDASALSGRSRRLDPETHTIVVQFDVDNAAGRFAVGAFARAHVVVGDETRAPAVPKSAVVDDNGQAVVFVQAEGEAFERRTVRLGAADRAYVAVLGGVAPGEHVVTRGAWSVKLAASSGSIPAHGHTH